MPLCRVLIFMGQVSNKLLGEVFAKSLKMARWEMGATQELHLGAWGSCARDGGRVSAVRMGGHQRWSCTRPGAGEPEEQAGGGPSWSQGLAGDGVVGELFRKVPSVPLVQQEGRLADLNRAGQWRSC